MPEVRDPVCGMMIDPARAAGSSTWQGTTYYFCSDACKQTFDAAPATYADAPSTEAENSEPRFTKFGPIVAPKFGSAGSGGAEYEPGPAQRRGR
jgi:YHS domain-containing protein